jgi:hypothetical protein
MASYDVAITYDVASTYGARHTIEHILNIRFISSSASYDVASTVHQSLPTRGVARL